MKPVPPTARRAFWLAILLVVICLLGVLVDGLLSPAAAALFFAVARGIRQKNPWAPFTAFVVLFVSALLLAYRVNENLAGGWSSLIVTLSAQILFAWFFLRAAMRLWDGRFRAAWMLALVAFGAFCFLLRPYLMPTASMEDTMMQGDRVLAVAEAASVQLGHAPQFGTVVIFHYPVDPRQVFVKRVAGAPGDRIRIVRKQLFRNGFPVTEPYVVYKTPGTDSYRDDFPSDPNSKLPDNALSMLRHHVRNGEIIVPPGNYFVLGDNRDQSLDSRYFGFVSADDIIGRPLLVYASQDPDRQLPYNMRWSRLLKLL